MDERPRTLLGKVMASVKRDRELPLGHLLAKGARFGAAVATAPFYLRACDTVGVRARTRGGRPVIENLGRITIGDDVQINSSFAPVRLSSGPGAAIEIGDGVNVNFGTTISAQDSVTIGHRVSFGPHVVVQDHDDDPGQGGKPEAIVIGDDVWLAGRVRVTKGSIIGPGTVVIAGSVVSGTLPPDVIAGGVPARPLSPRKKTNGHDAATTTSAKEAAASCGAAEGPKKDEPKADIRGVLVGDFSIQELARHLARTDDLGLRVDATVAPFGQVVQTLHQLGAIAAQSEADFAVIWTRPEGAIHGFQARLDLQPTTTDAILAEVDAYAALLKEHCKALKFAFVPTWVLPPWHRGLGMLDMKKDGVASTLMRMNLRLAEQLEGSNVHVLDAQKWIALAGRHAYAAKLWYMGKVGFSSEVFAEAARDVRAALRGLKGQAKKLVVLDLDDTLWGGIVGDLGWQNLRLGGHDALGESFCDFQRHLKALTRRGITLAVVSKNEESVALEAIKSHPEMVLKLEDISAHRINWRDKAQNIVEIAKELNLGLQSVVFIDDNPVERARVREALPEVYVPEWPDDKMLYVTTLVGLRCFDVPSISAEDVERTKMYAQERARDELKTQFASLDDWLMGLGMKVRFEPLGPSNLPRTTQLLNKTNQMNIRTRRLAEAELLEWSRQASHEVWAVHVSDKFGDAGLTGILSLEHAGDTTTVIDYVLSCRVMGRKVEETLLWAAVERARARGATKVIAPFFPTAKNKPALTFWKGSGFAFDEAASTFAWDATKAFALPRPVAVEGLETENAGARAAAAPIEEANLG